MWCFAAPSPLVEKFRLGSKCYLVMGQLSSDRTSNWPPARLLLTTWIKDQASPPSPPPCDICCVVAAWHSKHSKHSKHCKHRSTLQVDGGGHGL